MRYTHECSLTYFYPPFNKEFALLTAVCYGNFLWGCFSITHFSVANLVCPVPEDVCGDTAFAEVCRPARGADSTVPLLSVRTPEFLLCSFMTLRGLSLFCDPERLPDGTGRAASAYKGFCAASARSLYLSHIPLSEKNQIKNLQSC